MNTDVAPVEPDTDKYNPDRLCHIFDGVEIDGKTVYNRFALCGYPIDGLVEKGGYDAVPWEERCAVCEELDDGEGW